MEWELEWGAKSATGVVRTDNQDAILIWHPGINGTPAEFGRRARFSEAATFAAAVADGMGGVPGGAVASAVAIDTVRAALERGAITDAPLFLRDLADECHLAIRRAAGEHGLPGMGTTLTLLYIAEARAHLLHIGDSRCYRIAPRTAHISQWSRDHNLAAQLVASGALTTSQAADHPARHILTQVIGGEMQLTPQVVAATLGSDEEVFLLCSDGLSSLMSAAEIVQALGCGCPQPGANGPANDFSLQGAINGLISEADRRGSPDNVSVVALRFCPSEIKPRACSA